MLTARPVSPYKRERPGPRSGPGLLSSYLIAYSSDVGATIRLIVITAIIVIIAAAPAP